MHIGCHNKLSWLSIGGFDYPLSKNRSQKPLGVNHDDLFMHFLVMRRNGQVATNGCSEQVFF